MNFKNLAYLLFIALIPNFVQTSSKPNNQPEMAVVFAPGESGNQNKNDETFIQPHSAPVNTVPAASQKKGVIQFICAYLWRSSSDHKKETANKPIEETSQTGAIWDEGEHCCRRCYPDSCYVGRPHDQWGGSQCQRCWPTYCSKGYPH